MSNLSGFVKRIRDKMWKDPGVNGDAQRIEQLAWMLFLKVYDAKEQDWDMNEDDYESIIPEECRWCNWAVDDRSGNAMTGETLLNFVNNTLFPTLKNLPVNVNTPIKKSIVKTTFEDANQYMKDGVLLRQIINIIDELDLSDYEEVHAFGDIYESILKEIQSAGSAGEFYTPRAVTDFMAKMIQPQIGEKMADFACGTGGFITSWLKELSPKIKTVADQEAYAVSTYGIEKKQFPYILCITNMLLHGLDDPKIFHDNALIRDVLDYTEDDQFDVILMNPPYGGHEQAHIKNHFPSDLASSETADLFMAVIMYRLKKNGRAAVILPDGFLFGLDNAKVALKKKLLKEFNLHTIVRMPSSVFAPYTSITTNILFFDNTKPTEETWFYRMDIPSDRKHFSKTKPIEVKHFDPVAEWWNDRQEISLDGFDKAKKYTVQYLIEECGCDWNLCGYPTKEEIILSPAEVIQQYEEERSSLNAEINRTVSALLSALNGQNETSLLQHNVGACRKMDDLHSRFPVDMYKSILWSAIQGKLTTQYDYESADDIVNPIDHPAPDTAEQYFDIPSNWRWCRIKDIFRLINGKAFKPTDWSESGLPIVRIQNLNDKTAPYNYYKDSVEEKFLLHGGELLFSWSGTPGTSFGAYIWHGGRAVLNQHIFIVHPLIEIDIKYAKYALNAELKVFIDKAHGGAGLKHITKKEFESCGLPIPPIEEQKRIVAKLEEILPLCDRLK